MVTKLARAKAKIWAAMEQSNPILSARELRGFIASSRTEWDLAGKTTISDVIELMQTEGKLRELTLKAKNYTPLKRYVWGEVSTYRLAVSLWNDAYLSHASAIFLHGLTNEIPKTIYVNKEQSEKPQSSGELTQERLDMAFSRPQRGSSYVLSIQDFRVTLVSGKHTGGLEVGELPDPDGGHMLSVTKLERTLIDITVRPGYAGGVAHVLDAFRGAKDRARLPVIVATLKKLRYAYPYHQSLGFLLERAGFDPDKLEPLRTLGLRYDFYLTHGMRERDYDPKWRLFFPKGL